MPRAQNRTLAPVDLPEAELLLCCARICENSERSARIRALLQKELDWPYLLSMAGSRGMMPLLYWHLNSICPGDAVPKATIDHLRRYFHDNTRRNLVLTRELLTLLHLFEAQGILAVPYKGPTLAASVYGNLALRQFSDLDVLVHRKDVPRAKDLLVSRGYRPRYQLNPLQEMLFRQSQCVEVFERAGRVAVELHWEITPRYFSFQLDTEGLLERVERVSLAGVDVPSFSAEDLLLVLCVHGSKHRWERLEWICSVAHLLQRTDGSINWDRITERAVTLGGERMLFLGLFLAGDLLGAPLSDEVLERARNDQAVKALAAQVREQLFHETDGPPGAFEELMFLPFHLRMRERMRDRIRYCIRLAMTPTVRDWTFVPLPTALSPLYHIFRPIRLAGKYGRRVAERFAW